MVESVLSVAANLLSAVVIAALVYLVATFALRRRVARFFGFRPGRTEQRVYLSSIAVKPGGTIGTIGIVSGFSGAAITESEYEHALLLASSIQARPVFRLPQAIQGAAVAGSSLVESVRSSIELSPSYREVGEPLDLHRHAQLRENLEAAFRFPSVILIGAPVYNSLVFHAMSGAGSFTSRFAFVRESRPVGSTGRAQHARGFRIRQAGDVTEFIRDVDADRRVTEYFVIEKVMFKPRPAVPKPGRAPRAPSGETTVLLCRGTCTAATSAAMDTLRDWRTLARRYGPDGFGAVYRLEPAEEADREREPDGARITRVYADPPTES